MQDVIGYLIAMFGFPAFVYLATGNDYALGAAVFLMLFIMGTVKSINPN